MRSRPASTPRRAPGPAYLAGRRSPSPITGCRPTASPRSATISPPTSTRRASAAAPRAAIASATVVGGVTPYAALQAQSFRTPGYSETDATGGGFALAYNRRTGTDTRSELGARFDHVRRVRSRRGADLARPARLGARLGRAIPTLAAGVPGAAGRELPSACCHDPRRKIPLLLRSGPSALSVP